MSEEEKWEEEARKEADILYITRPVKMAYIQGYLQACKVREKEGSKEIEDYANKWLKKFNDTESGYLSEIKRLKEELASCQRELDRARGRGPRSWIEQRIVPE